MDVIIIAVFWLLGLLMAWSMCVVAARADRRMEEIRHTHGVRRGPVHIRASSSPRSRQSPCLISNARHVDCAEPYGRMAGRFRDMS